MVLRGTAAEALLADLGARTARTGWRLGREVSTDTYRLIPPAEARKGLADHSLRWATSKTGDASVLIKHKDSGQIAHHGKLVKDVASPAKLLGPAAWQAMAMATQQHYLVEINAKLASVDRKLDELLARTDDHDLGKLDTVLQDVRITRRRMEAGHAVSPGMVEALHRHVRTGADVVHALRRRVARALEAYRSGAGTETDVEEAWLLFVSATVALINVSQLLTELPYEHAGTLEAVSGEEQHRVSETLAAVRETAREVRWLGYVWSARWSDYDAAKPSRRSIALKSTTYRLYPAVADVIRWRRLKPATGRLGDELVRQARVLGAAPPVPEALLCRRLEDGSVAIRAQLPSVEPAQ